MKVQRNSITVDGSKCSDYAITKSSTTGEWFALFDVRGNTVQVGKFQTQTQAKEAIDNARAGLENTGGRERNVVSELLFVESEILPDILYVHRRTDTKQLKLQKEFLEMKNFRE